MLALHGLEGAGCNVLGQSVFPCGLYSEQIEAADIDVFNGGWILMNSPFQD